MQWIENTAVKRALYKELLMTPTLNQYRMNIQNKFDLYLENKLSAEEKDRFEQEMSEQPEMANSYKAYSQVNHTLKNELYSTLLNENDDPMLKDLSVSQKLAIEADFIRFKSQGTGNQKIDKRTIVNEYIDPINVSDGKKINFIEPGERSFLGVLNNVAQNKSNWKNNRLKIYFGIAASILLFYFAGKIIFDPFFSSHNKLSAQQAFTVFFNPRSDAELNSFSFNDSRLKNIFRDFTRSNVSSSAIFSNQLEVSDEDYELALLNLGIIYLERKDFPGARRCFNSILTARDIKKINSASYYLTLSLLAEGNLSEARPILNKLTETRNPYYKKAKAIQKALKQY